jgi:hypothetical protein
LAETLLGIETCHRLRNAQKRAGSTLAETLLGIETRKDGIDLIYCARSTLAETLLGIETNKQYSTIASAMAFYFG